MLLRPEVEITTHLVVQEIKELILILEKPNNMCLESDGKSIMDAMKSLRKMLEGTKIQITTTQLLFEIRGLTNILSRADLEMPSMQDQLKIFGSITNLRNKITKANSQSNHEKDSKHAEKILTEVNGLVALLDTDNANYVFDEVEKKFKLI